MGVTFAGYVVIVWILFVVALFSSFPPRRGMLFILLTGLLFLPCNGYEVVAFGPVKLTKWHAINYAMLLACLLYDSKRLSALSLSWLDLPIMCWCVCPAASAMLNDPPPDGGSSIRDALSQVFSQTVAYLIPYFIGRAYFFDLNGVRELAAAIVAAALIYVPLCLFEVRMSPQLHTIVYGYAPSEFAQQIRGGGYRPMVFLGHGLAVAGFMSGATLLAAWTRGSDAVGGRPRRWIVWVLGLTLVLCKSVGWILLAIVGFMFFIVGRPSVVRVGLFVLVVSPPVYCAARLSGYWDGSDLVQLAKVYINEDRAGSLEFRLVHEEALVARAMERPIFGWGGWGRNRIHDDDGKDVSVTDSLWIVFVGINGLVGLVSYWAVVLLPVARFAYLVPSASYADPAFAAVTGLAVLVALSAIDQLVNSGVDNLFLVIIGSLMRVSYEKTSAVQDRY